MHKRFWLVTVTLCVAGLTVFIFTGFSGRLLNHNPGSDCMGCHSEFDMAGTVFSDSSAANTLAGVPVVLIKPDGTIITAGSTNIDGNIAVDSVDDGLYLVQIQDIVSRTWHRFPDQASCNVCHIQGGNASPALTLRFSDWHTRIPDDNNCSHCHYFPQTMQYSKLICPGVINTAAFIPPLPVSYVNVAGQLYTFDPSQHSISTLRPDIFASGYYSAFDVILAICQQNAIPVEYHCDSTRMTHFITKINNVSNDYWYHWSYDAGNTNSTEITYKRANRWDELLWRPGMWLRVVTGEDLNAIKAEYLDEIIRENAMGHVIPNVRISINATDYNGNPAGSGRITATRIFNNIRVKPHNHRATGFPSPYPKPFNPGVITSMDILYSLCDSLLLDSVFGAYYTRFNKNFIESFYVVSMGIPEVGLAHSSGRQGFVYITENGAFNNLPNGADNKLHLTSDIHVIHAPDFSYWRWAELGNPYYEDSPASLNESIAEDYERMSYGFNLHDPVPNPFRDELHISFNIFEPGEEVHIAIYNSSGKKVLRLFTGIAGNIGIQKLSWKAGKNPAGIYFVKMDYGGRHLTKKVVLLGD